jgi:hypothetical protein
VPIEDCALMNDDLASAIVDWRGLATGQSPIANRQSPIANRQSPIANRQSPMQSATANPNRQSPIANP